MPRGRKKIYNPRKTLTLCVSETKGLGRVIEYMQQHPGEDKQLAGQTLQSRFLPFVLEKDDSTSKAIARQCMLDCLSYALAIANEWDLAIPGLGVATVVSNGNSNGNGNGNNASGEDAELGLVAQKKRRQENVRVMDQIMGL